MNNSLTDVFLKVAEQVPGPVKHTADAAAVVTGAATLAKWLPPVAAAFTIIWLGLQIFAWFEKRVKDKKKRQSKD